MCLNKKSFVVAIAITGMLIGMVVLLAIPVTYRQGINYKVSVKKVPLYYKLAYFVARDLQYRELIKEIVGPEKDPYRITRKVFDWTTAHIKTPTPSGLPVVDDHVAHIIIRGYGQADQVADVFSTLCSYAGLRSWMTSLTVPGSPDKLAVSFVAIGEKRYIFDPARKNYFVDEQGQWVDVEKIKIDQGKIVSYAVNKAVMREVGYRRFFEHPAALSDASSIRPALQMPCKRFFYELRRMWSRKASCAPK